MILEEALTKEQYESIRDLYIKKIIVGKNHIRPQLYKLCKIEHDIMVDDLIRIYSTGDTDRRIIQYNSDDLCISSELCIDSYDIDITLFDRNNGDILLNMRIITRDMYCGNEGVVITQCTSDVLRDKMYKILLTHINMIDKLFDVIESMDVDIYVDETGGKK